MQKSGKDFTIIKLLPPGVYQVRLRSKPVCALARFGSGMELLACFIVCIHAYKKAEALG